MIFFTSDTHFSHTNILRYCQRPFQTIEEMDEIIVSRWNACVNERDTVYHLGDFAFREPGAYRKRLKGKIILIRGNHDHKILKGNWNLFEKVHDLLYIKIENTTIVLCHFALAVWHKSHFNAWHCYGHSHGTFTNTGKSYDVGVDINNFTPVSFEQLSEIMKNKQDNVNLLKRFKGYDENEFQEVKKIDDADPTGEIVD